MKPVHLFFSLFFLFLLFSAIAYPVAADYSISYECIGDCVKNRTAVWQINFTNDGLRDIELAQVKLVDLKDGKIIAQTIEAEISTTDPSSIGSDRPVTTLIAPGGNYSVTINSTLPIPNYGSSLIYKFCTKTVREETYGKLEYTFDYCYPGNHTIPMLECTLDSDCLSEERCSGNKCVEVECGYCQYPAEHKCSDYQCCKNDECALENYCLNHQCLIIECNETNYIFNHSCVEVPCKPDELIINESCIKTECAYNEYASRYRCHELDCAFYEGYINHSCLPLECAEAEGYVDHTCQLLDCTSDESISNHTCQKLSCGFLTKPEAHACLINTPLFIELTLFLLILILIIADIKKYNGKYRKRLVDLLMKRAKNKKSLDNSSDRQN